MPSNLFRQVGLIESFSIVDGTGAVYPDSRDGYYPRVLSYTIGLDIEGTITFQDGGVAITGAMPVAEGGLLHTSLNPLGHFDASEFYSLLIIPSGAAKMNGHVTVEWIKRQDTPGPQVFAVGFGLDPKVAGFWQMEESSGTRLAAIGPHHFPVLSGNPTAVPGKHNQAMRLTLGDALELPLDPVMGLDAWTVAGWVRLNDPMTDFTLLSNWHGPNHRSWAVFHSGHRFRTAYSTDGDNDIREMTNNVNTQSIPAGSWVFVVARFNRVLGISRIQATVAGDPLDTNAQDTLLGPMFDNTPNDCLSVGTELSPAATAEADFDSLALFDFWVSDAGIDWLYDNGAGIG